VKVHFLLRAFLCLDGARESRDNVRTDSKEGPAGMPTQREQSRFAPKGNKLVIAGASKETWGLFRLATAAAAFYLHVIQLCFGAKKNDPLKINDLSDAGVCPGQEPGQKE